MSFVLAGPGGNRTGHLGELDQALNAGGIRRPRRGVAAASADQRATERLLRSLNALALCGVADQLVLSTGPDELSDTAAALERGLEAYPGLDITLVATKSPDELLCANSFLIELLPGSPVLAPRLWLGESPASGGEPAQGSEQKYVAELAFWRATLDSWVGWYDGASLGNLLPPGDEERETRFDRRTNAAVTFSRCYQEMKYLTDLALHPHALRGARVLDVGCGPAPNLLAFQGCEPHGLDPLIDAYREAGYPIDVWSEMGYCYHSAPAEAMPFPGHHFDAVVSVNAIDHIDDFAGGAAGVRRVLRPGGTFRMHVHYHPATATEPLELDDEVFLAHYGWVPGLRRIAESDTKDSGLSRAAPGELYVLWGNT